MSPAINCPVCDGSASRVSERFEVSLGTRRVEIEGERFRCDECGEAFYSPEQMDEAQSTASTEIRRREGLLQPSEIRAIRAKYALSLAGLERLLGLGPKTAIRWERGTVFQNKATDQLLRVMRDVPAAFAYLAAQNGVAPSEAAEPSPAHRARSQKYGVPIAAAADSVVDLAAWRFQRPKNASRVTPNADVPPLPQEALK